MQTLYVTDLDGTFLGADGRVSSESVRILAPLLKRGLPFTVATARSPATVVSLLQGLSITLPAVLMTGTMLFDLRAARHWHPLPFFAKCAGRVPHIEAGRGRSACLQRKGWRAFGVLQADMLCV